MSTQLELDSTSQSLAKCQAAQKAQAEEHGRKEAEQTSVIQSLSAANSAQSHNFQAMQGQFIADKQELKTQVEKQAAALELLSQ